MQLIYMCVFHQESYVDLLKLLMTSIWKRGNVNSDTTDILIVTSPDFQPLIEIELKGLDLAFHYQLLDLDTLFEAGCARLRIFQYPDIHKYETILYLDTDILIHSDLNILFHLELSSEKLYALEEGEVKCVYFGSQFFDFSIVSKKTTAFTSGILLFRNSMTMKVLFDTIQSHIEDYISNPKNKIPMCLDQPFIVYNAISQKKYENQLLIKYVENNPSAISPEKVVYHFPGGPGKYASKLKKMNAFWSIMNEKEIQENSFV